MSKLRKDNELLPEASKGVGHYLVSQKLIAMVFGDKAHARLKRQQAEQDKSILNIRGLL